MVDGYRDSRTLDVGRGRDFKWAVHGTFGTFGNTTFAFREEADASAFILRWA